jgi:ADP-ribose pyrophosphatase YjhB (NUDIX family)
VAAYGVIIREESILLTRLAPHVAFQGWTLPGGGVDHGEDPREALRREIFEEAGLRAEVGRVLDVHSSHFTGARPDGVVEDYHGLHIIFDATIRPESLDDAPQVIESDGSTDEAAWIPFAEVLDLKLTGAARHALEMLGLE